MAALSGPFFKDEVRAIVSKLAGSIDVAAIACVQKASPNQPMSGRDLAESSHFLDQ